MLPLFSFPWCGISLQPISPHSLLGKATAAESARQASCKGSTEGGDLTQGHCKLSRGQLREVTQWKVAPSPRKPVDDDLILYTSEKNAISESIKTTLEELPEAALCCAATLAAMHASPRAHRAECPGHDRTCVSVWVLQGGVFFLSYLGRTC